ncbi:MAG: glycosyltransferase family 61 protein [Bacteroidia bacterium]|nr:glycosyltransferase family 61 protein [Bacteroidia bacterium]
MINKTFTLLTKINHKLSSMASTRPIHKLLNKKRHIITADDERKKSGRDDIEFIQILDSYEITMNVPNDFMQLNREELKPSVNSVVFQPSGLYKLFNAKLYTDSFFMYWLLMRRERSFKIYLLPHSVLSKKVFTSSYLSKPQKVDWVVFSLVIGGGGNNYFHWLFDALPRLHLLKESGQWDLVDKFVCNYKFPFHKETLKLLGIREDQIIDIHEYNYLQPKLLMTSTHPRKEYYISPWMVEFLQKSFVSLIEKDPGNSPHYIYTSRGDAKRRVIINEKEVIELLKGYDFEIVSMTAFSFIEQVRLFHFAKVIVAPHGANLANIAFCQKNTRLLEVFTEEYVAHYYYELALRMGMEYSYLICKAAKGSIKTAQDVSLKESQQADILIDMEAFKEKVAELGVTKVVM